MTLNEEDAKLFYQLWFPLLNFVNQKYNVCKELPRIAQEERLDPKYVKKVADYLWSHPEIIDEYLKNVNLPAEHQEIISDWKTSVTDRFVLERHLKKGSIFIAISTEKVYQVCGIISSWEEMLGYNIPPVAMDATLIPFKDVIISDGLVSVLPISFGGGYRSSFKEIYMDAKKKGTICVTFKDTPKPKSQPAKRQNSKKISYVISVSIGKGCYRHIRVSGNDTLDDLAGYILNAFDFDFDHLYSFFMDNQWWSDAEEYASPYAKNSPYAHEAKLSKFAFQKGRQFKFLFDYGDEWRFQCKVLQVLDEETKAASVISAKGKAPEQYPVYDEDE